MSANYDRLLMERTYGTTPESLSIIRLPAFHARVSISAFANSPHALPVSPSRLRVTSHEDSERHLYEDEWSGHERRSRGTRGGRGGWISIDIIS